MNQSQNPKSPRPSRRRRKRPPSLTKMLGRIADRAKAVPSLPLTCDDESVPLKIARVLGPYRNGDKWRLVVFDENGRKALLAPSKEEAEKIKAGLLRMFEDRSLLTIGAALEAAPRVFVKDDALRASLEAVDFAELCITSGITIVAGEGPAEAFRLPEMEGVAVVVEKAQGVKCARSWKYFDPLTAYRKYPDITPRDAEAVAAWDAAHGRA